MHTVTAAPRSDPPWTEVGFATWCESDVGARVRPKTGLGAVLTLPVENRPAGMVSNRDWDLVKRFWVTFSLKS